MGDNGYRKPRLMQELGVEIWLNDPQGPLEHQVGSWFEEYRRIYAAIKRCSYGYPHAKVFAVRPRLRVAQDNDGRSRAGEFEDWVRDLHDRISKQRYITKSELDNEEAERDDEGRIVALTNRDLARILATDHANISRGLAVCRSRGLLKPGFPFELEPRPCVIPPERSGVGTDTEPDPLTLVATVFGLQVHVSTDTSEEVVQRIRQIGAEALRELSALRRKHRTRIRELGTETGILIGSVRGLKNTSKKGKKVPAQARSNAPPPPSASEPALAATSPVEGRAGAVETRNGYGTTAADAERPDPALTVSDSEDRETDALYDRLRSVFEACGRPVTGQSHLQCWRRFLAEALATRRHIVEDAALRAELIWGQERNLKWVPDLLAYLQSRDWEQRPIARPKPPASQSATRQAMLDDMAQRLLDRAQEKEQAARKARPA